MCLVVRNSSVWRGIFYLKIYLHYLEGFTTLLSKLYGNWDKKEVIQLDWKLEKDTLTIYPQGDLDLVSAKRVKEDLEAILYNRGGLKSLIINLGDVGFMDSSGLGMLIGCYKEMHARQGKMMICDANDNVYRVLELSGMKKLMPVMRLETQKTARGEGYGKR